jgi:hypothetical protein
MRARVKWTKRNERVTEEIVDADALPPDIQEELLRRSSTKYKQLYKKSIGSLRLIVGEIVDADTLPLDVGKQWLLRGIYNEYEVSVRLNWLSFLTKIIKLNLIPHSKTTNLWFIGLSEEYQAHLVDKRNKLIEAGKSRHSIRCELICYWFIAAVWTPIFSQLQKLIPPGRRSK